MLTRRDGMRWLASGLILFVLLALAALARPASAQSEEICYAVADEASSGSGDALVRLDKVSGVTTSIGATGTTHIEAIALEPGTTTLYAANAGQFGTLDTTTGTFTPTSMPFGTGSGALGTITFSDVDGLTVDPTTGILYGTHRRRGSAPDVLFQVDKVTGAHVDGAFTGGADYVAVTGSGVLGDIDDIAVDPVTAQMFGATNLDGAGGNLLLIDKATGATTEVGPFGVDDIEGLAFFTDGQLYGSTGKFSTGPDTENQLYLINETTGEATFVAGFSQYKDYEALACLSGPTAVSLSDIRLSAASRGSVALLGLLVAVATLTASALFLTRRHPPLPPPA